MTILRGYGRAKRGGDQALPGEGRTWPGLGRALLAAGLVTGVALQGCHLAPGGMHPTTGGLAPAAQSRVVDTAVSGRVNWAPGLAVQVLHGAEAVAGTRHTQATTGDLVNASTVSLINTGSNTTVATGLTNASGVFTLNLSGYTPTTGETDILEAVKGLSSQAPGANAARVRTILEWNGSAWLSITNAAAGGNIVIDALTTAVAIESELDPVDIPPANTIGKVNATVSPAVLVDPPGPYTNHPDAEIVNVASELVTDLGANADPVASIPAIMPTISSFTPNSAIPDGLLQIDGNGFSAALGGNTVTVGGAAAEVVLATPTQLVVVVPPGAVSGTISLTTGRGNTSIGGFNMLPSAPSLSISGFMPNSGRAGATVTIGGSFPNPALGGATPSVFFASPSGWTGVPPQATVTAWTQSQLTVTLPVGAAPGVVSVTSGGSSAASSNAFNVDQGGITYAQDLTPASASIATDGNYELPFPNSGQGTAQWSNGSQTFVYLVGGCYACAQGTAADDHVLAAPINPDGSMGEIQDVAALNTPRLWPVAEVYGNWLYALGGSTGSGCCDNDTNSIEMASINSNGTLSGFSTQAATLNTGCGNGCGGAIWQNHIYLIGGLNSAGTPQSTIQRFDIDTTTGAISYVATYPLTVGGATTTYFGNSQQGDVVIGNNILVTGGLQNGAIASQTFTIPLNSDGSVGGATADAYGLWNAGMWWMQDVVVGSYVYVLGGASTTDPAAESCSNSWETGWIGAAPINTSTGQLTGGFNFVNSGFENSYAGGISQPEWGGAVAAVAVNPGQYNASGNPVRIYEFGGVDDNQNNVDAGVGASDAWCTEPWRATTQIQSMLVGCCAAGNGASWTGWTGQNNTSLMGGEIDWRYGAANFVFGNKLWTIGGYSNPNPNDANTSASAQSLSCSEYFDIEPDGSLGPSNPGPCMNVARYNAFSDATSQYVYVTGGCWYSNCGNSNAPSAVERAPINGDGTIGNFVEIQQGPAQTAGWGASAIIGNYWYLFGGYTAQGVGSVTGPTYTDTIERATINPDGSLSPFAVYPETLPHGAGEWQASVVGNKLYLVGEVESGVGTTGYVYDAAIDSNGDLGEFTPTSSLLTAVYEPSLVQIGNSLYAMGGCNTGGGCAAASSTQVAVINPDGTLGPWHSDSVLGGIPAAPWSYGRRACVWGDRFFLISGYNSNITGGEAPEIWEGSIQ